jgi:RES domain-containing protein
VTLWRISNYRLLDGHGGMLASGRWHTKGRPIVYCTQNAATALLEVLAHLEIDFEDQPVGFRFLEIDAPDGLAIESTNPPSDWRTNLEKSRAIGDEWLQSGRTPLLQVPCAVAPLSWNMLVNPLHPDAVAVRIVRTHKHLLDPRLVR